MDQQLDKIFWLLLYLFSGLFVFLIYPWGGNYYYANCKAYYFIGWMILLAVLFFWRVFKGREKGTWKFTLLEWLYIIFLLLVGFSTFQSAWPSWVGNLTEHQGFLIMSSYGILFVMISRLSLFHHLVIFRIMVVSSFLAAIYGILQHFGCMLLPQDMVYKFGTRGFSFFDNPDYFGSYLVLVILLCMALFLASNEKKNSLIYFGILCTLFLSLLESETRSAWLGVAIGFMIITVLVVRKRKNLWGKWISVVVSFSPFFPYLILFQKIAKCREQLVLSKMYRRS